MDRATQVVERLKGPVVPLNICFNEDGTVNQGAVGEYVNWLCEEKTPVLLLTYGSSEFASLSDEELWELTATVARANAGRSLFITPDSSKCCNIRPVRCRLCPASRAISLVESGTWEASIIPRIA